MTEKDLLDSLRFVDDDLIEEAGLEQLKEEKQKKINGKVIFLRTALTAAAGICIFTAGIVMGRKITAKKDQTDGALMMAAYTESEYEKEILALEGSETLAEAEAYAEPEDKNTLSVSTITLGKETKSQISEDETSHTALPATSIGGIDVFFYKKEDSSYFFASFEQNNVSYTLQADTLRKVVQAAADTICGMGIVTVVD